MTKRCRVPNCCQPPGTADGVEVVSPTAYLFDWLDRGFSSSFKADGLDILRVPAAVADVTPLDIASLVYPDTIALDPTRNRLAISAGNSRLLGAGKRIAVVDLRAGTTSYLTDEKRVGSLARTVAG